MGGPSQSTQNQQTQSWANLNSLFNTASTAAGNLGTQGQGALDSVTSYFKNILGSRQGAAEAEAPAVNAATAGGDAAKKQEAAMGSGRTGGGVAGDQQRQDTTRSNIDTLIAGGQSQAAQGLTAIGSGDVSAMMSALGIGTSAASTTGAQSGQAIQAQQQQAAELWGSLVGGAGGILGGAASAGKLFGI